MALTQVYAQFKDLSLAMKIGIAIGVLVIITAIVGGSFGLSNYFHNRAYEKREAERVQERNDWMIERQALQNKIAASEALTEAAKKVVEAKRKDTLATIEELQHVERTHEQTKEQIEQQIETGNTESIDKLRRDMDDTLCKRGYKAFCPK